MRRFKWALLACAIGCSLFGLGSASAQTAAASGGADTPTTTGQTANAPEAASPEANGPERTGPGGTGQEKTPRPLVEPRPSRKTARSKGDITFDDLKFDIEKGGQFERSMLTQEIEALHKQTVRLRGYILPNSVYKSSGIEQFVLVRDNMECCFGPGAAIYDCVLVNMEKGKTTDFTTKPVAVRGKFEIEEFKFPDGSLAAIYKLTASEVK